MAVYTLESQKNPLKSKYRYNNLTRRRLKKNIKTNSQESNYPFAKRSKLSLTIPNFSFENNSLQ